MNHRVAIILLITLSFMSTPSLQTAAQGAAGDDPGTPVPFGESASVGLYSVTVTGFETDASAMMVDEAARNHQWVSVTMSVTNDTESAVDSLFMNVGIAGSRGQLTTSYWNSCSDAPVFAPLPPNESRSVTSCLSVNEKDLDNAVLWIQDATVEDGEPTFAPSATWFEVAPDSGYDPAVAQNQFEAALGDEAINASSFEEPADLEDSMVGAGFRIDVLEYTPVDASTLPEFSQARIRADAGYDLAYLLIRATNISDTVRTLTASVMGPGGIGYAPVSVPEPGDTDGHGAYLPGGTAVTERLVVLAPDDAGSEVIVLASSKLLAGRGEDDEQFAFVLPPDRAFEPWTVPESATPVTGAQAGPVEAAPGETVALGGWEITADVDTESAGGATWTISLTNATSAVKSNRLQAYSVDAAAAEIYCGYSLDLDPDPWLIAPRATGVYDRGCNTNEIVLHLQDLGSPAGTMATFSAGG
jgi:hypothetical protein